MLHSMLCRDLNFLRVVFEALELFENSNDDVYGYVVVLDRLSSLAARITNPKNSGIRRGVEHIAEVLVEKTVRALERMTLQNDHLLSALKDHSLRCIKPLLWSSIITSVQSIWNCDDIPPPTEDLGTETLVHLDEYEKQNLFDYETVKLLDCALRIHLGLDTNCDVRDLSGTDAILAVTRGGRHTEMFLDQVFRAKRAHMTKLAWIEENNLKGINESQYVPAYKIAVRSGDGPRYVGGFRISPLTQVVVGSSLDDDLGYSPPQSIEQGALRMTHGLDDLVKAVLRFKLLEGHEDESAILSVVAGIYIGFILQSGTSYCLSMSRSWI